MSRLSTADSILAILFFYFMIGCFDRFFRRKMSTRRMASAKRAIDCHEAHSQLQSPLFGKLPAEIRNEIFELALQQYEDPRSLYERNTFYTRPGSMGAKRFDTALLQTCKRAYAETKTIPFKDLELSFYFGHKTRVPNEYLPVGLRKKFEPEPECFEALGNERLSSEQWSAIKHVHIFAQLFAFNNANISSRFGNREDFKPSVVTITIRYTDWWHWENNRPLDLMNLRTFTIVWPDSVEKLIMQFETREGKKKELEWIVKRIMDNPGGWQYSRETSGPLCIDKDKGVKDWTWEGPTKFGKFGGYPHHGGYDTMGYIVKELTWKPAPEVEEDND